MALDYYRALLIDRPWLAEGVSWTVVQPAGPAMTVDEVVGRLRAEPITVAETEFRHVNDLRPGDPSPLRVAHLRQVGADVVMVQTLGAEGARKEVLRWLSDRARVHTVSWTINGNGGVSYAVYGTLLGWVDKNDPDRRWGSDPGVFDGDLADLREARRLRDADEWPAGRLAPEAAALATVERRTGVRLRAEWLDDLDGPQWTTVMIGLIPNDPRPPGRFGVDEPDLDARLRGAPEPVRRQAVVLALREVLAAFVVSDEDVAASVVAAVERGAEVDPDLRTRAFRLTAVRPRGDRPGLPPSVGALIVGKAFHEAVPLRYGDPLDSLGAVRTALGDSWPGLRRRLADLVHGRSFGSAGSPDMPQL